MSSFPPTLRLVAPRGMRGHPGLCSCARSGLHPGFWKGWWLCPCGGARGNEVFRVARAARNTLWELCALWKARTPLKECQDLLQDSETCRGFGLAPRLLWQERWGAQGVPNAPGMPVGEQPGWWQHPRAMAWGSNLGTAWNVGLEGLGSGQQGVQWLGSAGVHGHARASLLVCSGVRGTVLSSCCGVGRTRDAESGRGPWLVSGSVQASSAHAWGQIGLQLPPVPPDPPDTPCSLP